MKKKLLVWVDAQNDFISRGGKLSFDNGAGDPNLVVRMYAFLNKLDENTFDKVVVTYDTHSESTYYDTDEAKNFPIHCVKGTKGHELVVDEALLDKAGREIFRLEKDTHDMFADNENTMKLPDGFLKGVPDVYVAGVASDICNRCAMEGFLERGHRVFVIEDLTKGIFKETNEVVNEPLYEKYVRNNQLNVISREEFFDKLDNEKEQTDNNFNNIKRNFERE